MRFASFATFSHYQDHLWPLIEELRSRGHTVDALSPWRNADWAEYRHPDQLAAMGDVVWLTASAMDAKRVPGPTVYLEHGAGQTYEADERGHAHKSYSTGRIDNALLYLCPNFFVYTRRRRAHPEVPAVCVGSPRLDAYPVGHHEAVERAVAFVFHWDCEVVPETRSAFDHYVNDMLRIGLELRRNGYLPVAHAHPRISKRVRHHLGGRGFDLWDIDDVMTKAAVLVADNTSVLYEFAHVDRPIVVLNAPWYRRDVHHGLRFWEVIPGVMVDEPDQVIGAVRRSLDSDPGALVRRNAASVVFPLQDGATASRACDVIELAAGRL